MNEVKNKETQKTEDNLKSQVKRTRLPNEKPQSKQSSKSTASKDLRDLSASEKKTPPRESASKRETRPSNTGKPAKKTPKIKKTQPAVKLSGEKVFLFCSVIFLVCALCLSITILRAPVSQGGSSSLSSDEKSSSPAFSSQAQSKKVPEQKHGNTSSALSSKKTESDKKVPSDAEKSSSSSLPQPSKKNSFSSSSDFSSKSSSSFSSDAKANSSKESSVSYQTSPSSSPFSQPAKEEPPSMSSIQNSASSQNQKTAPSSENSSSLSQRKSAPSLAASASPSVLPPSSFSSEVASASLPYSSQASSQAASTEPHSNSSSFVIPQAQKGATLVIVIDDAGRSAANTKKYAELPFPISIAVLPSLPQTRECADVVVSYGQELLLHQPMQAVNLSLDPGPGAITAGMAESEIAGIVNKNLDELGRGVSGLNNHEGSLITANLSQIGAVLDVCAQRGIYFLDSRTTSATKAPIAAADRGMRIYEKSGPYIDNVIDRNEMLKQIYASLDVANKKGKAIIIGHVDKSVGILPDLLKQMYPCLSEKGYRFSTPSRLP